MIVHVIGRAGSGKSTLIQAILNKASTPNGFFFLKLQPKKKQYFLFLLLKLNISAFRLAYISACVAKKYSIKKRTWFSWFRAIVIELYRKHVNGDEKKIVILVDQGLSFMLYNHPKPASCNLYNKLPLPNLIVNVSADPIVSFKRVVYRNKAVTKGKQITGVGRELKLVDLYKYYRGNIEESAAIKLFMDWNNKFCQPPLSLNQVEETIKRINKEVPLFVNEPCTNTNNNWFKKWVQEKGVVWVDIKNDDNVQVEALAEELSKKIATICNALPKQDFGSCNI